MKYFCMNGAGNSFVVLDARGKRLDFPELAKSLCALHQADGLIAVGNSDKADFKMIFYNADGSLGEMCGNGARCICRFANELGIAGESMTVQTDAGLVPSWHLEGNQYRIRLNTPTTLELNRVEDVAYMELGNPGLPHAVREYRGDLWADSQQLRPEMEALRHHPAFPKGANVNYYSFISDTEVRVLTFERGVEDFTLACGTGGGSVACVLWLEGKLPESTLTAHNRGGTLKYTISGGNGVVTSLLLEGPTEVVRIYEL